MIKFKIFDFKDDKWNYLNQFYKGIASFLETINLVSLNFISEKYAIVYYNE